MKIKELIFVLLFTATVTYSQLGGHKISTRQLAIGEQNFYFDIPVHYNEVEGDPEMEKYLREALENFREQMKEGIDAIHMPRLDPLDLRNLDINVNENLATMSLKIKQITVEDLSTFDARHISANLETFFLKLGLNVPTVRAKGKYLLDGRLLKIFPINGNGSFSINVTNMDIAGTSKLEKAEGTLQAHELDLNLSWSKLNIYLENFLGGGSFSNVLQKVLPNVGKNIFDNFKPKILTSLNGALKNALNKELRKPEVKSIIEGLLKNY